MVVENYAKITTPDGFDLMISDTVYNKIIDDIQFCDPKCSYFKQELKGVGISCQGECSIIADSLMYHNFTCLLKIEDLSTIEDIRKRAYVFARRAHAGLVDDEGKDYFFTHLLPVYKIINLLAPTDVNLHCAALLHDTLEDTPTKFFDLENMFGIDIAYLVLEVTHERTADDLSWYFPHLKSQRGILLKFADRTSNISRMKAWDTKRQQKYLDKSKFWVSEDKTLSPEEQEIMKKYKEAAENDWR
jgi:hypothetical protein